MDQPRTAYVVIGPHRSGASAMARILSLAGAKLPRDLVSPHAQANPTGSWESRAVIQLNESILERHGGSWSAPVAVVQPSAADADRAAWIFERMFAAGAPIVIKDPRISLLTKFWLEALQRADRRPLFVLMHRPRAEVSASLSARDGLPEAAADDLWRLYAQQALAGLSDHEHAVVRYADVLANPRKVLERLGVEEPERGWDGFDKRAGAFLSPELHRQRASSADPKAGSAEDLALETRLEALAEAPVVRRPPPAPAAVSPLSEPAELRWVLISGAPRSGTTLLRALVDDHPGAAILQEFGLTRLVRGLDTILGRPKPVRPVWDLFTGEPGALGKAASFYASRPAESAAGWADELTSQAFDNIARGVFAAASVKAATVVGDKMPMRGEWEDLAYLQHRLPDLKLLVVVRNPRDVIHSSMLRRARQRLGGDIWPIASVQEAAKEWWLAWRRTAALVAECGDAVLLLRYEDLCRSTEETMSKVWAHLDLPPHTRSISIETLPDHINVFTPEEQTVVASLLGEVVQSWNEGFSARELLDRFSALPAPYVFGQVISAASPEADAVLAEGFSWRESWGRWTDGERALIRLRHGEPKGWGLLELTLGRAFSTEGRPCDFILHPRGGAPQLFSVGPDSSRVTLLCDLGLGESPGELELSVVIVTPKTALEAPADDRRLGLGLESLSLRLIA